MKEIGRGSLLRPGQTRMGGKLQLEQTPSGCRFTISMENGQSMSCDFNNEHCIDIAKKLAALGNRQGGKQLIIGSS